MTPESECRQLDPSFRIEHENAGTGVAIVCRWHLAGKAASIARNVPLSEAEAARAELVAFCLKMLRGRDE